MKSEIYWVTISKGGPKGKIISCLALPYKPSGEVILKDLKKSGLKSIKIYWEREDNEKP